MSSPTSNPEQERLEEKIERDERELRLALTELQVAASHKLSPRTWVAEHPWLALSAAAAIGFALGRR